MNDFDQFERRLADALRSDADASVGTFEAGSIARAAMSGTRPARRLGRGRGMTLLAAAALLVVGGALAGSGFLRLSSVVPPLPAPSVVAVATASPDATSPSPTPTVRPSVGPPPSDPIGPLAWTQASLKEDWPAPVREEPAGGATVLPILHRDITPDAPSDVGHDWESDQYRDPTGDTGSDVHPWADIRWVEFSGDDGICIGRGSDEFFGRGGPPPGVDPRQLRVARGVVVDSDGDGVPDWRFGVDNVPLDTTDAFPDPNRWWRTDLHTGRTAYAVGDHINLSDGGRGPIFWSPSGTTCMKFGAESTGDRPVGSGLPERFYAWTSVIVNGRVVATDYAPDVGWLDRSPDAKRLPKPGGSYVLQDPFPVHLSMTVPDGWTDHGRPELTRDGVDTVLQFRVDNPEDPCLKGSGQSIDDVVSYLQAQPNTDISEIRYVTLDGYRAAYVEYDTNEYSDCVSGGFYGHRAWIVDVDGVRMVIAANSASTRTVRSEVQQIVESIQIIGVSPPPPVSPTPSPSPTASPTPRPTPLPPAAGPVPPKARSWTVTVDNKSSEPVAVFVAEEGDDGTLRLVGSASPNVIPARATVKVTFLFPAKGGPDGWIYVNPRPGEGGSFFRAADIGTPGKFVITAEGDVGWLSP